MGTDAEYRRGSYARRPSFATSRHDLLDQPSQILFITDACVSGLGRCLLLLGIVLYPLYIQAWIAEGLS